MNKIKPIEVKKKKGRKPKELPKKTDAEIWSTPFSTEYSDVCKRMKEQASIMNLPQPDFDYRDIYTKGQILWYINKNDLMNKVALEEIKINKVYPRAIIGFVDEGEARCISFSEREMLFDRPLDAEEAMKDVKNSKI